MKYLFLSLCFYSCFSASQYIDVNRDFVIKCSIMISKNGREFKLSHQVTAKNGTIKTLEGKVSKINRIYKGEYGVTVYYYTDSDSHKEYESYNLTDDELEINFVSIHKSTDTISLLNKFQFKNCISIGLD